MVDWGQAFFDWGGHNADALSWLFGSDIPLWVGQLAFITELLFIFYILLVLVEGVARMLRYIILIFFVITSISLAVVLNAI